MKLRTLSPLRCSAPLAPMPWPMTCSTTGRPNTRRSGYEYGFKGLFQSTRTTSRATRRTPATGASLFDDTDAWRRKEVTSTARRRGASTSRPATTTRSSPHQGRLDRQLRTLHERAGRRVPQRPVQDARGLGRSRELVGDDVPRARFAGAGDQHGPSHRRRLAVYGHSELAVLRCLLQRRRSQRRQQGAMAPRCARSGIRSTISRVRARASKPT